MLHLQVGRVAPRAPLPLDNTSDPELAALQAEIESLQTKLTLYRRREQLDLEYNTVMRIDTLRALCAPIIAAVAREFDIPVESLLSRARPEHITLPRLVAMTLCRETFGRARPPGAPAGYTLEELGAVFHRDHGCILNAARATQNRCDTDPAFCARVTQLRTSFPSLSVPSVP